MSSPHSGSVGTVAHFDGRPFFEKALRYGLDHGLIGQTKLAAINDEAPKGMVQIARYFASEFLRPELEKARERLVNLVSLHLEHASQGDLSQAAQLLRDNTLLSRSKAGSDMLKALIVMPQNTHFGMNERGGFSDRHIPQLARWSLATYAEFQSELATRQRVTLAVQGAMWMATQLGMSFDDLQDCEPDAEAVIRTALLVAVTKRHELPDWAEFEKIILTLRKKDSATVAAALKIPKNLPQQLHETVERIRLSVLADLPKLLDTNLAIRKLFDQTPAYMGRYFWIEDALGEVAHYDRARSSAWDKITRGRADDSTLLTLFLCVAAGASPKTLLSDKSAANLIRKIRKTAFQPTLASAYIQTHAPQQYQNDYQHLWDEFLIEAKPILLDDRDTKLTDALALLRRECNVA